MSYNWEKIFKDKSTEELYKIYKGNVGMPLSTISIAEKELKSRNFQFEKTETNPEIWRLSRLMQQENDYQTRCIYGVIRKGPLHILSIYIMAIFFAVSFVPKQHILTWLPVFIAGATVFAFAHYRKIRKHQETSEKRRSEIAKLSRKLKKEDLLSNNSAWYKDVVAHKMKNQRRVQTLNYLFVTSALIVIIIDTVGYLHLL